MMPRIFLHDEAKADLERIADYIARDSFMAAQLIFPAVWDATVMLARMPGMGRAREFENPDLADVRSWVIRGYENYLMFYRPVPGRHRGAADHPRCARPRANLRTGTAMMLGRAQSFARSVDSHSRRALSRGRK